MTSSLALRAARFRDQNSAGRLLLPNAWDAASARIFEEAGFTAIGTTSAGIAYAEGHRDAEQIDRDAMVRAIAKIVKAVSVPVTADIEGGYGPSPDDVAQTVDDVLDVGAAGVNLEDTAHYGGTAALLGVDEQCERIAAARDAATRRAVPLVINARTALLKPKRCSRADGARRFDRLLLTQRRQGIHTAGTQRRDVQRRDRGCEHHADAGGDYGEIHR